MESKEKDDNTHDCPHFSRFPSNSYCDKWQSDNLKREERLIK
jgi:hypothetical protein